MRNTSSLICSLMFCLPLLRGTGILGQCGLSRIVHNQSRPVRSLSGHNQGHDPRLWQISMEQMLHEMSISANKRMM